MTLKKEDRDVIDDDVIVKMLEEMSQLAERHCWRCDGEDYDTIVISGERDERIE